HLRDRGAILLHHDEAAIAVARPQVDHAAKDAPAAREAALGEGSSGVLERAAEDGAGGLLERARGEHRGDQRREGLLHALSLLSRRQRVKMCSARLRDHARAARGREAERAGLLGEIDLWKGASAIVRV